MYNSREIATEADFFSLGPMTRLRQVWAQADDARGKFLQTYLVEGIFEHDPLS